MTVSKRTRFEVLRRDNHTCRYCGGAAPDVKLTVDHVAPVALGGSDDPSNLVTACKDCNAGKTSTSPSEVIVADVSADAARWARAMAIAAERSLEKRSAEDEYLEIFRGVWTDPLPRDWRSSVGAIRAAGLPVVEVVDVARIAGASTTAYDPFSYFCGICWKRVRALQADAQTIIDGGEL